MALTFASSSGIHPLASVDRLNPRPGLRRWVAANTATDERARWKEAWLSIHHDGSVTLAAALGGHRIRDGFLGGHQVESRTIECGIADFMALIRATARETGNSEYDLRVGVEWTGENPLIVLTDDGYGFSHDIGSTPLQQFTPVESTVDASEPDIDFYWHVYDVAQDCVNQGGTAHLHMIKPPARNSDGQGTSTA
ncbi:MULTISPECIES: hypothetical protein [Pseudonocardia]|uniref:hypothetical protein n=1 Tax=Pseudonocardia TaxID=1847 RepID=UPI0018D52853|nr:MULTISPECIES: hypothetical protein [Pseudonocardia]